MTNTTLNITADLGDNSRALLEKLAQTIGTTAEKVWPWIVRQKTIEGYGFFLSILGAYILAGLVLLFSRSERKDESADLPAVAWFIAFAATGVLIGFGPVFASHILNPEYHALQTLVEMLRK